MSLNTVVADAPVHYLKLDDATGTAAVDSGSKASTVTVTGAVITTGVKGNGRAFDGNDNLAIASPLDFSAASSWTVECWFKSTSSQPDGHFIRRDGNGRAYLLRLSGGKVEFYANQAGILSPKTYNDGQWHHAVGVMNINATTLYVDGVQVGTGLGNTGSQGTTPAIHVGSAGGNGEFFIGSLDEVAIYNKALTSARVLAHYQEVFPPSNSVSNQAPVMVANVSTAAPVVTTKDIQRPDPMTVVAVSNDSADLDGSTIFISYGTRAGFRFDPIVVPDGYVIDTARLVLTAHGAGGDLASYKVHLAQDTNWANNSDSSATLSVEGNFLDNTATVYGTGNVQKEGSLHYFDVKSALLAPQYTPGGGLVLLSSAGSGSYKDRDVLATAPKLVLTLTDRPQVPAVAQVPPMMASATMPQHRPGVGSTTTVTGTGSASVEMAAPVVKTIKSPRTEVKAMTVTVQFPGGVSRNPDYSAPVEPMDLWLSAPPVNQFVGYPNTIVVEGAMNVDLAVSSARVDLRTDRRLFVTNSMGVSAKMVGIYSKESDRYFAFVPSTVDADDLWLPLDEVSGTIARDATGSKESGDGFDLNHGEYVGSPELHVTGAYLRKAARFDGVDDHLRLQYQPGVGAPSSDTTIEFSIKTTQLDGVLLTGNGWRTASGAAPRNMTDSPEVRLVSGELALYAGSAGGGLTYPVRKFVADGEWHHIVISIPASTAATSGQNATRPYFVTVDGRTVWQRFVANLTGFMAPSAMMARVNYVEYAPVVSQVVAGDLSNVIVRVNSAISPAMAQKLYYEWSESLIIKPGSMTVSASMKDPAKARGNSKRMIALYGLPFGPFREQDGTAQPMDEAYTYYSIFAGYYIDNEASDYSPYVPMHSNNGGRPPFLRVKPFVLEDYIVYPVAITGTGANYLGGHPQSAAGMEKPGARDPYTGSFIDDETGLSRFIDLDQDLAEPITNFDAITAVNYPTANPEPSGSSNPFREPRQTTYALTNGQWLAARDRLRDSILSAAYRGVNLWVNEPWMAQHLGIIQGWDKHAPSEIAATVPYQTVSTASTIQDPASWYGNTKPQELDLAHKGPNWRNNDQDFAPASDVSLGRYHWTNQINSKRRIVATEPGLTNLPSFERGEYIQYQFRDRYKPYSNWVAYDVLDRMSGLTIGDRIGLDMLGEGQTAIGPWWGTGDPRRFIVSAKPQGIVGKVIAREDTSYYGPNGMVVDNPYKDNAYTIAVERGSVVRGQAIKGRIFVEFMSADMDKVKLPVDKDKNKWKGRDGEFFTTWSFDSRRYAELVRVMEVLATISRTVGGTISTRTSRYEARYAEVEDPNLELKPFMSMNSRGLNWLAAGSTVPAGDARIYTPAMEVDVSTPTPKATQDRGSVNVVIGAMRVDVDLRQPSNFRGDNVAEKVSPMVINLRMPGLGKAIKVGPMEITLTAGANTRAIGDGDRIYVYLDARDEVTLFMKED